MWRHIEINRNLVKAETGKAVLIAMPHKSEYSGFAFWHPAKLVWGGRNCTVSVRYTDHFVFRLKKCGRGRYNKREVLVEQEISANDLRAVFAGLSTDDYEPEEPEIYTPEPLEPENAVADESLIDY